MPLAIFVCNICGHRVQTGNSTQFDNAGGISGLDADLLDLIGPGTCQRLKSNCKGKLKRIAPSQALAHDLDQLDNNSKGTQDEKQDALNNIHALAYLKEAPSLFANTRAPKILLNKLQTELKSLQLNSSSSSSSSRDAHTCATILSSLNAITTRQNQYFQQHMQLLYQFHEQKASSLLLDYLENHQNHCLQPSKANCSEQEDTEWEMFLDGFEALSNLAIYPPTAVDLLDHKTCLPLILKLSTHPHVQIRERIMGLCANLTLVVSNQCNLLLNSNFFPTIIRLLNDQPKIWGQSHPNDRQEVKDELSEADFLGSAAEASVCLRAATVLSNLLSQHNLVSNLNLFSKQPSLPVFQLMAPLISQNPTPSPELKARAEAALTLKAHRGLFGLLRLGGQVSELAIPRALECLGRLCSKIGQPIVSEIVIDEGVPILSALILRTTIRPPIRMLAVRLLALMISVNPSLVCLAIPKNDVGTLRTRLAASIEKEESGRKNVEFPDSQLVQDVLASVREVGQLVNNAGATTREGGSVLLHAEEELKQLALAGAQNKQSHEDEIKELASARSAQSICAYCGQYASKRCARCKRSWYCGTTCLKAHWPTHKNTCTVIQSQIHSII